MQKTAPSRAIICSARICPQAGTRSALWSSNVVRFLFGERYSGAMGASRLRIGAMPTLWGLPWGTHATLTRSLFRNLGLLLRPPPSDSKAVSKLGEVVKKSSKVKMSKVGSSLVRWSVDPRTTSGQGCSHRPRLGVSAIPVAQNAINSCIVISLCP